MPGRKGEFTLKYGAEKSQRIFCSVFTYAHMQQVSQFPPHGIILITFESKMLSAMI